MMKSTTQRRKARDATAMEPGSIHPLWALVMIMEETERPRGCRRVSDDRIIHDDRVLHGDGMIDDNSMMGNDRRM